MKTFRSLNIFREKKFLLQKESKIPTNVEYFDYLVERDNKFNQNQNDFEKMRLKRKINVAGKKISPEIVQDLNLLDQPDDKF